MNRVANVLVGVCAGVMWVAQGAAAQDWSQWRGDNRDGKAAEFSAPATWPKDLNKQWDVTLGDGVATPSLVGDRLYVFSRQDGNEIARCLNAADGSEIWKDSYVSEGTSGGASGFQGPRCSPTVVDGKVVTLGVRGVLSCLDAATGKVLWRKDDFPGEWPRFYTSSSPIVVDGLCIAQLGGDDGKGAIVAYDLATGEEKWRAPDLSPSYASPMLVEVDGEKVVIAPTESNLVGVSAADGKLLWKIQFTQGRYNAATPIVDGNTLILAGPGSGMSAISLTKDGAELKEEQLWNNTDNSVQFSSPVLKDGLVFGLSNNNTLFCIDAKTHETKWSQPLGGPEPPSPFGPFGPGGPGGRGRGERGDRPRGEGRPEREERPGQSADAAPRRDDAVQPAAATDGAIAQASEPTAPTADQLRAGPEARAAAEQGEARDGERRGPGGRRGFGRGGRGRGRGGYGSVVDAGDVMMVLTPAMELVVYKPSAEGYTELGRHKVSETATYAYPVASGKRIFIKDQDKLTLWTVE
jgi:outer membrane protein assembly factor BamB